MYSMVTNDDRIELWILGSEVSHVEATGFYSPMVPRDRRSAAADLDQLCWVMRYFSEIRR